MVKHRQKKDRTNKAGNSSRTAAPFIAGDSGRRWALAFLLAVLTILVYRPVDRYPFIHTDDTAYVTDNAHVRSGLSWVTLKWALTSHDVANWHPLTWLSHALDCQLFGLNPARHHDVNVILHALNAVLLFWVLVQATGFSGRSFMVAALFALHPINVESVAWISERKTLLSVFFFLLAMAVYRWYARKPRIGPYLVVALSYALALMAKPLAITFPCVLLLWDYWPLRRVFASVEDTSPGAVATPVIPQRRFSWLILEKIPLLGLSIASAKLTITAQFGAYAEISFSKSVQAENAVISYVRYLGKAFWPSDLAFLYPHRMSLFPTSQLIPAILLLLAISAFVALCWRRRYLTVGWLWFLGTLVPMIGVIQVGKQAMADRYAYLPFVGLFIMVCWGLADLATERRVPFVWQAGVSAAALAALIVVTHQQLTYWTDDEALWTHTLRVTSRNWGAEDALGTELFRQKRIEEAAPHFFRAVELAPHDFTGNLGVGTYQAMHGNYAEAIDGFRKAASVVNIIPQLRMSALFNLGQAYLQVKDYDKAREIFTQAVAVNPQHQRAWIGLGVALQQSGHPDLAVQAYSRAMSIQPVDWVYLLLARALEQTGHKDQAQAAADKARLVSQNFTQATRIAEQILRP